MSRSRQRLARVRGLMACMCGVCVSVSGLLLGQSATCAMMTAQAPGVGTSNVTDTGGDAGPVIDTPQSAAGKSFSGTVTVCVGPGKFDFYTIDVAIRIDPCDDKGRHSDKDHGQGICRTCDPRASRRA